MALLVFCLRSLDVALGVFCFFVCVKGLQRLYLCSFLHQIQDEAKSGVLSFWKAKQKTVLCSSMLTLPFFVVCSLTQLFIFLFCVFFLVEVALFT